MSSWDTREWRVGSHYGVHLYAVNPGDDRDADEPIASFLGSPEQAQKAAEQVVREHSMLSAPYADDEHQGGHWLDVLPQRPRWASVNPEVGRCGKTMPYVRPGRAPEHCALPHGHAGWHRADNGMEMGEGW